jgi:hypothetical protein
MGRAVAGVPSRNGRISFLGDRRGIVAIEFALVAPLVLLMFTGTYSMLMIHLGGVALEGGTAAAARATITGNLPTAGTREDTIREIITWHVCPYSLGEGTVCYWAEKDSLADGDVSDPLIVETLAYVDPRNIGRPEPFTDTNANGEWDASETFTDVNGNGQWDRDMGTASAGGAGDHVLYDVHMRQAVNHPLLVPIFGRTVTHRAQLVVRNEPY